MIIKIRFCHRCNEKDKIQWLGHFSSLDTDLNLADDYQSMFDRLNNDCQGPIFERQYKIGKIIPLHSEKNDTGNILLSMQSKFDIKMLAEDIVMTKTPYILILASCYSHRSEVSNLLRSSGIYSVLHISEDLGKLTQGKSFFLSQEQWDLLQLVSTQLGMKDIFIYMNILKHWYNDEMKSTYIIIYIALYTMLHQV